MKKYLYMIESNNGAWLNIGFYCDTPCKNYRIYYNGSDTGLRYEHAGHAANYIKRIADAWNNNGIKIKYHYKATNEMPRRGSNAI